MSTEFQRMSDWRAEHIATDRVLLEPLRIDHATEMTTVLADEHLYVFTGGEAPSLTDLERRYATQVAGNSEDDEAWLNWIVRLSATGQAIGYVQASLKSDTTAIAWTTGVSWQGNGYATEAATAMATWLRENGAPPPLAWIHPAHDASQSVARALGPELTNEVDKDGEQCWSAT